MHMVLDLRQESRGERTRIGHGNISRTICLRPSYVPASKSASRSEVLRGGKRRGMVVGQKQAGEAVSGRNFRQRLE